jgi:hypothetical protein
MTLSVSKSNFSRERAGFFDSPPFFVVRSDREDAGGHFRLLEKNSAASQLVLVIDQNDVLIAMVQKLGVSIEEVMAPMVSE